MQEIQQKLETLPEGNLIFAKNGKKYLSLRLKTLSQELRAIEFYLKHHDENAYQKEQALLENPEFQKITSKLYQLKEQKLIEWMKAPYKSNEAHPEQLIHNTIAGIPVRSKSEVLITRTLSKYNIPFRYECALQLGDKCVYPDFTIIHPITGEVFYYEHFGMMDDEFYSQHAFAKSQLYTSNGIIPTVNLITTFETKENPLSERMVEDIVKYYFL